MNGTIGHAPTEYLTYESTPGRNQFGTSNSYTAATATATATEWRDGDVATIDAFEQDNHDLRQRNLELKSKVGIPLDPLSRYKHPVREAIRDLERHCRGLEEYIDGLEGKQGYVDRSIVDELRRKNQEMSAKVGMMLKDRKQLVTEVDVFGTENMWMAEEVKALRRLLMELKGEALQDERQAAVTEEKAREADADVKKLQGELQEAQARAAMHRQNIQKVETQALTAEKEMRAVRKWNSERKCNKYCKCSGCCKKGEPWEKYMAPAPVDRRLPANTPAEF